LHHGDLRMAATKYRTLNEYVEEVGGPRLRFHGPLRERLVEMAVEEFPADAADDHGVEVLAARLRRRVKQEYGSIVAMLIISVLANLIARAVWEWWKKRHANQVLMAGWQAECRARASKG